MNTWISQKNWFVHSLVWLSYYFLLVWFFSDILGVKLAMIRASLIVGLHTGIFYLNLLVLLPYVLEKKLTAFYYLVVINLIILLIFAFKFIDDLYFIDSASNQIFLKGISDLPSELKEQVLTWRQNNSPKPEHRFFSMRFLANGFSIVIILLFSSLYRNGIVKREKEKEASLLKSQMLEAESKILKWQINPHFLFNTLNNIYALSQMKSDRAPDAVHRLSEMLRYVIYDCNEELVSLDQEINYIKSYIALQLLKDDEISNVHYQFPSGNTQLKIAPMLLISYIENSFKHSKIEDLKNGWINIELKTQENKLFFEVKNSIPEIEPAKDRQGGIGLENVKRRLSLIYPKNYELIIEKNDTEYSVRLTIELG